MRVIAVRAAIDHLKKRRDFVSLTDEGVAYEAECAAASRDDPLSLTEDREKRRMLKQLLDELAPKDRLFMRLFYFEGLPPAHIANILHTTTNAVYARGSYLREKLKENLAKKLSKK